MNQASRLFLLLLLGTLSFSSFAQSKAYFFKETFENTTQWQKESIYENILLTDNALELRNSGSATVIESSALLLNDADFLLTFTIKSAATGYGLSFKDLYTNQYQIIKFNEGNTIHEFYNEKKQLVDQKVLQNSSVIESVTLKRQNGVTQLTAGSQPIIVSFDTEKSLNIGVWLNGNTQINITQFDIESLNQTIHSVHLFEDEENETIKQRLPNTINTSYHEVKPIVSSNGQTLYFTRKNDPLNSGKVENDDVYFSERKGKNWATAQKMPSGFNDANHNVLSTLFNDGSDYLILDQYAGGKKIKDTYRTISYKDGKWGKASKISFESYKNESSYISACISNDGNTLILSLKNEESNGGNDLYISVKKGKKWSKPQNLGLNVNTSGEELSPFLSADNSKLYFSSNGWPGYGSNDIFVCERKGSLANWSKPKNLGSKVNSPYWDAYFSITADQSLAFISTGNGSVGGMDIYEFRGASRDLTEPLAFKGFVYDSLTMEPLQGATISVKDIRSYKNTVLVQVATNELGYFETELPVDTDFDILVEKQYYNGQNDIIWHEKLTSNTVKRNYYLNKYNPGQRIAIEQIYFVQGKDQVRDISMSTVQKLYTVLSENPEIRIMIEGHTDDQGPDDLNLILSQKRTAEIKQNMIARGVDASRMETVGYGETRPLNNNRNELERRLNRRVEFLIIGEPSDKTIEVIDSETRKE